MLVRFNWMSDLINEDNVWVFFKGKKVVGCFLVYVIAILVRWGSFVYFWEVDENVC